MMLPLGRLRVAGQLRVAGHLLLLLRSITFLGASRHAAMPTIVAATVAFSETCSGPAPPGADETLHQLRARTL